MDGSRRIVRLASGPSGEARGLRQAGLRSLRRDDDALLRAAQVTEYRSVRDLTAALVTEQGKSSYSDRPWESRPT